MLEIPDAVREGVVGGILPVIVGVIVAGISGYFAVRFMIKLITKHSFRGFAVYTAVLGLFIIIDWNFVHLLFNRG